MSDYRKIPFLQLVSAFLIVGSYDALADSGEIQAGPSSKGQQRMETTKEDETKADLPDSDAPQELDRISVSASRAPRNLRELGSAVTVFKEADFELRQYKSVYDVLQSAPGVAMTRTGGFGQETRIRMRGFTTKHVLILIDGIKVNNAANTSNDFNIDNLLLDNVERIEVLRGPQSGLYGADSMAGVISITTKRGSGPPTNQIAATAGSNNTYRAGAGSHGEIGDTSYSANLTWTDSDSISAASRPPGNAEDDGYRNITVSGSVDQPLSKQFAVGATLRYVDANTELDTRFGEPPLFLRQDSDSETDSNELFTRIFVDHKATDGKIQNEVAFSYVRVDQNNRIESFNGGFDRSSSLGEIYEASAVSTIEFNRQLSSVVGAEHSREEAFIRNPGNVVPVDDQIDNTAVFTELMLEPTPRLFLSAAGRYDANDTYPNELTYRVSGSYTLPKSMSFPGVITRLKSSGGTGAEKPSLTQLFADNQFTVGNPDLSVEESWMYDVGIEQRLASNRARWQITYYDGAVDNGIFSIFNPDLVQNQWRNLPGKVKMQGVETELSLRPFAWLTATVVYTWSESIIADTGQQLFARPENIVSGNLAFEPNENWKFSFEGYHRSDFLNAFPSGFEMPGYELFHLSGNWTPNDKFKIAGRISNLFDKDYEERLGENTFGRIFEVTLSQKF